MANRDAFTHKPSRKRTTVPVVSGTPLFRAIFDAAMKQDWWEDGVGLVGNDFDKFYFDITGLSTGFACLEFDVVDFLRTLDTDPRAAMVAAGLRGSLDQILEGGDVHCKGTKRLWEELNEAA